jgi:hypothetical protein
MRKGIIIVLIVSIIAVCSFLVVSAYTSHSVVSPTGSPQESSSNSDMEEFYHRIDDFNIEIKPADGKPLLNKEEAIEIAKKDAGERISNEAKSIMAMYVKLTDRPGGENSPALVLPGTNIVMEDIPVWIVTFHGVNVPFSNAHPMFNSKEKQVDVNVNPYVYGDLNIVIDANTGNVLEEFSYNIPKH